MTHDLVVRNGTVVGPETGTYRADVAASDERISAVANPGSLRGDQVIDADGKHVLPGVIDPHTHHGIARSLAADAESESRSDLVGGVTTVGNFFRRGDPYLEVMDEYVRAGEANYYHDYFFSLGLLSSTHLQELPRIVSDLGITSFKWYGNYKGVAAEKFGVDRNLTDDYADEMIRRLADMDAPTTLGYHSENVEITRARERAVREAGTTGHEALTEAFPARAEAQSLSAAASLADQHGYAENLYAVHVSSAAGADELARLQDSGVPVTGETCIHYLLLGGAKKTDAMRVNPPIRTAADEATLWERVADGTIDCIGTDHCCKPDESKRGDTIWDISPAFPGSPVLLPAVLTRGVREGRIDLQRAVEVTSTGTAKAWNLYPRKGTIRVGADADLVVVDLDSSRTVTPEFLRGAAGYSPYEGMELFGWPTHTVVRGTVAYENGEVVGDRGDGTHVDRPVATDAGPR